MVALSGLIRAQRQCCQVGHQLAIIFRLDLHAPVHAEPTNVMLLQAGTIRIVVHEEVMAADWDDAYCWGCDAPGNRPHAAGSPGQGSPSAVQGKTCMTQGSAFTKNDEPSADHSRSSGQDRHVARPPCDDVHTWGGWGLHLCGCGRVLAPGEVMAALRKAARDQGAEAGDSTDDEDDMLGAGAGTPVVKEEQGHSPDTHPHSHLHDHSHQHTPQRHEQAVRGSGGKGGGVACSSCQTASDRELTDAEGVLWAHHVWLATGEHAHSGRHEPPLTRTHAV